MTPATTHLHLTGSSFLRPLGKWEHADGIWGLCPPCLFLSALREMSRPLVQRAVGTALEPDGAPGFHGGGEMYGLEAMVKRVSLDFPFISVPTDRVCWGPAGGRGVSTM